LPTPAGTISPQRLRRLQLLGVTFLFATLTVWLFQLDRVLHTEAAPQGIVSFELARTAEKSAAILDSWSPQAREAVMLLQGLDYLYLVVYPVWLSLLGTSLAERLGGAWQRIGLWVSTAVILCAPFDAIENHALIVQVMRGPTEELARRAWFCASVKFAFFFTAVAYIAAASVVALARRMTTRDA
jgi:hypothetical protein